MSSSKKNSIGRKRKVRNYKYLEGLLVKDKFYSSLLYLVIKAEDDGTLLLESSDGIKLALSVKQVRVMTPKDIENYLNISLRNHLVKRAWEQYKELEASL